MIRKKLTHGKSVVLVGGSGVMKKGNKTAPKEMTHTS